jgi:hypothetical protein
MRYLFLIFIFWNTLLVAAQIDKNIEPSGRIVDQYSFPANSHALKLELATSFRIDFQQNDFSNFKSLLGDYNILLMNNSAGTFGVEMNAFFNNWMAGFEYGYFLNSSGNHDSLDLEFNTINFSLLSGYRVVDTKRFIIVPGLKLTWNRYRLINSAIPDKIPMTHYLDNRDLDIRFNQMTASAGIKAGYKLYNVLPWMSHSDYMSVGIYGGYIVNVNQKPWIYSVRNRLINNDKIDLDHFNFGISITFYSD